MPGTSAWKDGIECALSEGPDRNLPIRIEPRTAPLHGPLDPLLVVGFEGCCWWSTTVERRHDPGDGLFIIVGGSHVVRGRCGLQSFFGLCELRVLKQLMCNLTSVNEAF